MEKLPFEYVMIVGDVNGTYMVSQFRYSGFASDHGYAYVNGTDFLLDILVAGSLLIIYRIFERRFRKFSSMRKPP